MQTTQKTPETLSELFLQRSEALAERLAYRFLIDGDVSGPQETRSYHQLGMRARAIGACLQTKAKPKDRALLLYAPGHDFMEGFLGAQLGGLIPVPAYPPDLSRIERSLPRLRAIISDCQASLVLTTRALLDLAESFFELSPELSVPQWIATDEVPSELCGSWKDPGLGEIAFLQYTSGSTGEPKGVKVTHQNLLANLRATDAYTNLGEARVISWLPPYHDMGLLSLLVPIYNGGYCTFFSPLDFLAKPVRWLQAISHFRANSSAAPNFAFDLCARKTSQEEADALDLRCWRVAPNGGEPVRSDTLLRFYERFKERGFAWSVYRPGFGMAETTLTIAATNPKIGAAFQKFDKDALSRREAVVATDGRPIVSNGPALPEQRVIIVDPETKKPLGENRIGEIWLQGSFVTEGYWQKPELNEEVFGARLSESGEGPFLRSGDLGFLHNGELYITGRLKDLIIMRGKNFAPQDIELSVERSHFVIRPGCVTAFSLDINNRECLGVMAEVDTRKTINPDDVFQSISRSILEEHDISVSAIWLVAPGKIPKTSSGKLQRFASREGIQKETIEVLFSFRTDERKNVKEEAKRETDELVNKLLNIFAKAMRIKVEQLDPNANLSMYGFDSIFITEITHVLNQELKINFNPFLFGKYPTISSLAQYLKTSPKKRFLLRLSQAIKERPIQYRLQRIGCFDS